MKKYSITISKEHLGKLDEIREEMKGYKIISRARMLEAILSSSYDIPMSGRPLINSFEEAVELIKPYVHMSTEDIAETTGLSVRQVDYYTLRAQKRVIAYLGEYPHATQESIMHACNVSHAMSSSVMQKLKGEKRIHEIERNLYPS